MTFLKVIYVSGFLLLSILNVSAFFPEPDNIDTWNVAVSFRDRNNIETWNVPAFFPDRNNIDAWNVPPFSSERDNIDTRNVPAFSPNRNNINTWNLPPFSADRNNIDTWNIPPFSADRNSINTWNVPPFSSDRNNIDTGNVPAFSPDRNSFNTWNVPAFFPERRKSNKIDVLKESALPENAPCFVDGYPGTCLPWRKCFNVVIDLRDENYPPLCSHDGPEPIICCTSCQHTEDVSKAVLSPRGGLFWKTNQISWNKCIDYSLKLPYDTKDQAMFTFSKGWNKTRGCFEYLRGMVKATGGRDAKRAEFPHMALLGYGSTQNTSQWLCGGSLLNERFILTAGHCISSPAVGEVRYAALGILKRSDPQELWQTYRIQKIIPHPHYRPPSKYHDIALLQTRRRIAFNVNVLPICLPNLAEPPGDERALATGWGVTGPLAPPADTLQAVKVNKFTRDKCSQLFQRHRLLTRGFSEDTQMCYGDEKEMKDTCEGDSGGPLQVWGQAYHLQGTVIGVTSYGPQCKYPGQAGVYTRVRPYVPWIDSIIWNDFSEDD